MATAFDLDGAIGDAPFPLYGVAGMSPLTVSTYSATTSLSLLGLGHGERERAGRPWVEVIVTGPLHGTYPDGPHGSNFTWEEHAEDLALFHVVVANDPTIDGQTIPSAEAALAERWTAAELTVDGTPQEFQLIQQGRHWGAIRHIEPDHAIVLCASNVDPADVQLQRVSDTAAYLAGS